MFGNSQDMGPVPLNQQIADQEKRKKMAEMLGQQFQNNQSPDAFSGAVNTLGAALAAYQGSDSSDKLKKMAALMGGSNNV